MLYHQAPLTKSRQQSRLHWLLLLSILLQSVAPTALAASTYFANDGKSQNSESGIWTISCAGKTMWLPIPQQSDRQTGIKPGWASHSDSSRHCLICFNLTGTDLLPSASDRVGLKRSTEATAYSDTAVALIISQRCKRHHPRAPPVVQE